MGKGVNQAFVGLTVAVAEAKTDARRIELYFEQLSAIPSEKIVNCLDQVLYLAATDDAAADRLIELIATAPIGPFHRNICNSTVGILERFAYGRLEKLRLLYNALNNRQMEDLPKMGEPARTNYIGQGVNKLFGVISRRDAEAKQQAIDTKRAFLQKKMNLNLTDEVKKRWDAQEPVPTTPLVTPDTRDFTTDLVSASLQEGKLVSVTLDVKQVKHQLTEIYPFIKKEIQKKPIITMSEKLEIINFQVNSLLSQASGSASAKGPSHSAPDVKKEANVNLSSFMPGLGSDHRHSSLLNAHILSQLIKDGDGGFDKKCEILHVQTEILPGVSAVELQPHSFILFKDENNKFYILDSSRKAETGTFSPVLEVPKDNKQIEEQYGFTGDALLKQYTVVAIKPPLKEELKPTPPPPVQPTSSSAPPVISDDKNAEQMYLALQSGFETIGEKKENIIRNYFHTLRAEDKITPPAIVTLCKEKILLRVFDLCTDEPTARILLKDAYLNTLNETLAIIAQDKIKAKILEFAIKYPAIAKKFTGKIAEIITENTTPLVTSAPGHSTTPPDETKKTKLETFETLKTKLETPTMMKSHILVGYLGWFDRVKPQDQPKVLARVFVLSVDTKHVTETDVEVLTQKVNRTIINDNIRNIDSQHIIDFAECYPSIAEKLFNPDTKGDVIEPARQARLAERIKRIHTLFEAKPHPKMLSIFNTSADEKEDKKAEDKPSLDDVACKIIKQATEAEKHPTVGWIFFRKTISPEDIKRAINPVFTDLVHTDQANLDAIKEYIKINAGTPKFDLRGGHGFRIETKPALTFSTRNFPGETKQVPHRVGEIYNLINSTDPDKVKKIIMAAAEARAHGSSRQSENTKKFYEAVIRSLTTQKPFNMIDVTQIELEENQKPKPKQKTQ